MGISFLNCIIFILLSFVTTSLSDGSMHHFQTASDLNNYEAALRNLHNQLTSALPKLQSISGNALTQVGSLSSSQILQKSVLQQAAKQERIIITQSLNNSALPLSLKTWDCKTMSQGDIASVNSNIGNLQNQAANLQNTVNSLGPCGLTSELQAQSTLLSIQINNLKAQTANLCPSNPIPPTPINPNTTNPNTTNPNTTNPNTTNPNTTNPNTTNPNTTDPNAPKINNLNNAPNWVYGSIPPADYANNVSNLTASGSPTCPPEQPFVDQNNNCISCPNIYDLSTKSCSNCQIGSLYNSTSHTCDPTSQQNSNTFANNFVGTPPKTNAQLNTCPSSHPYFLESNQSCITCGLPNYFDYNTNNCLQCGVGQSFDVGSKSCKNIPPIVIPPSQFNSALSPSVQNFVGTPPTSNGSLANCPDTAPFFNGVVCISCSLPLYFDFGSNSCHACPVGHIFDSNKKICAIDPANTFYLPNIPPNVNNYKGTPPTNSSIPNGKGSASCPPTAPFSNGNLCVQCLSPSFFNFDTGNCERCPQNYNFDLGSKLCVQTTVQTPYLNSNIQNSTNFMYAIPPFNASASTCDSSAPFFNGSVCISCNLPSYFNFKTLKCENCPVNLTFNIGNRQCEYINQSFVTDLSNPNIYFNGDYSTLQTAVNLKKSQNPSIQTCSGNLPFYDATKNICIACPSDDPLYNIKYNLCMKCSDGSIFLPANHICVTGSTVKPSLQRMMMNSIGLSLF